MALTGIDPNSRTPGDYRELLFAQGVSPISGGSRDVLIYGNKTAVGSEPVDAIGGAILSDADAQTRFGKRSEAYQLFRAYVKVDPGATIYICAPTESAGSASLRTITFASAATDVGSWTVALIGERASFGVLTGDTPAQQASACAAAINAASEGKWPVTAAASGAVVTVTAANNGPRGGHHLDKLRIAPSRDFGTTATVGALVDGTVEDDFSAAYAAASQGEYAYQVNPKFTTDAPSATDGGVGEGIAYINEQALPINGKSQSMFFGLTCTQTEATGIATDSDANAIRAFFFRAQGSDWTPGMIAAHCCAAVRAQQVKHPSANLTGYTNDSAIGTVFQLPDPYDKADRPTATEIEADLRNGITPIAFSSKGRPYIVRHITSRSLNGAGESDYRASEGHIPSAVDFAWAAIKRRWHETKQPFCADEIKPGEKPLPKVSYPSSLRSVFFAVIDDLCSASPGGGVYTGPVLDPSKRAEMKSSVAVAKVPGGFSASCALFAVQHNNRSETTVNEVGPAY